MEPAGNSNTETAARKRSERMPTAAGRAVKPGFVGARLGEGARTTLLCIARLSQRRPIARAGPAQAMRTSARHGGVRRNRPNV